MSVGFSLVFFSFCFLFLVCYVSLRFPGDWGSDMKKEAQDREKKEMEWNGWGEFLQNDMQ